VERVAKRTIDPGKIVVVLVGDREKIEEPVRSLNLGPIELRSIDDVLGKPPAIDSRD